MRHLRKFNEDISDDIFSDVEDIVAELEDDSMFNIDVTKVKYTDEEEIIKKGKYHCDDAVCVDIEEREQELFRFEDIKDVVLRLEEWGESKDLKVVIEFENDYLSLEDHLQAYEGEELYYLTLIIY